MIQTHERLKERVLIRRNRRKKAFRPLLISCVFWIFFFRTLAVNFVSIFFLSSFWNTISQIDGVLSPVSMHALNNETSSIALYPVKITSSWRCPVSDTDRRFCSTVGWNKHTCRVILAHVQRAQRLHCCANQQPQRAPHHRVTPLSGCTNDFLFSQRAILNSVQWIHTTCNLNIPPPPKKQKLKNQKSQHTKNLLFFTLSTNIQ